MVRTTSIKRGETDWHFLPFTGGGGMLHEASGSRCTLFVNVICCCLYIYTVSPSSRVLFVLPTYIIQMSVIPTANELCSSLCVFQIVKILYTIYWPLFFLNFSRLLSRMIVKRTPIASIILIPACVITSVHPRSIVYSYIRTSLANEVSFSKFDIRRGILLTPFVIGYALVWRNQLWKTISAYTKVEIMLYLGENGRAGANNTASPNIIIYCIRQWIDMRCS